MTIRVCVCGGGAIAHVAAAVLGARPEVEVSLLTRNPDQWFQRITVHYGASLRLEAYIGCVTNNPALALSSADWVLLTVPAFAREEMLHTIAPHLHEDTWVGCLASSIGFDWQARDMLGPAARVFGFQRIPWVARTLTKGSLVEVTGVRSPVVIAGHPALEILALVPLLSSLLGVEILPTPDYLAVTLGFDNPTLHAPRLYSLFAGSNILPAMIPFYREWDDGASELLLQLDEDMQMVRRALSVEGIPSAKEYFDAPNSIVLSQRIRSIEALKNIHAPIVGDNDGWKPDIGSRYFQEDILYGLAVQRAVADVAGVPVPAFDAVLSWAEELLGQPLRRFTTSSAISCDLPLPQRYGIASVEALMAASRA